MNSHARKVTLSLLVIYMVFALAGCGGQPAKPAEPAEAPKAAESIPVGVVLPMTGANAYISRDHLNGFKLAIDEANAAGGISGRKIELFIEDDRSTPSESVSCTRKLITQHKVVAILGPFNSSCALAARDVTKEANVPQLLVGASTDSVVVGYPNVFRLGSNNTLQTIPFVEWLVVEKGKKNVAVLYENTDWGRGLCEMSEKVVLDKGVRSLSRRTITLAPLTSPRLSPR